MAICVGGKWCRRQECRKRCESWFGTMPDVADACKSACHNSTSFTREQFLCSGKYIDKATVIARYKYDPCPGQGLTVEDFLDPLNDREREDRKLSEYGPVIAAIGFMLLSGLIIISISR